MSQGTNLGTRVTSTLWIAETEPVPSVAGGKSLATRAYCNGAPPTTASVFAHGCEITQLDSATSSPAVYQNTGSSASPVWTLYATGLAGSITRATLSAAAGSKTTNVSPGTIATTSNTDAYVIVPETGAVSSIDFSGVDALAANDTNYITFSVTNLGQAGGGSTAILAATDANTTKATGGTALAANTKRTLTLNGTAANLNVVAGDRLRLRAAATGTLANTVTFPTYIVRYSGTT